MTYTSTHTSIVASILMLFAIAGQALGQTVQVQERDTNYHERTGFLLLNALRIDPEGYIRSRW